MGLANPMSKTSPLPAGLRALSLTKRQAVTLAPSWPHGIVAAFEPYLVSVNKTSLLLWDRRTLALVLAVPAEGVQGAVAFVELELPAGERGWGQQGAWVAHAACAGGIWAAPGRARSVGSPKSRLVFQCQRAEGLPCRSIRP